MPLSKKRPPLIPEFLTEESTLELNFKNNIPQYCYSLFNSINIQISSTPTTLYLYQEAFDNYHEFAKKKVIWARKSGTILWSTNYEQDLKEKMKISFDIKDYANEKTFNISLFEEKINKFEKFSSIKNISIHKMHLNLIKVCLHKKYPFCLTTFLSGKNILPFV